MNDRFKFRIALHQDKYEEYGLEKFKNQRIFEVKTINVGYENSTVEIIADYQNGDWAVREIDEADVELMQCTGLKDKNGTLIFEKDYIKYNKKTYKIEFDKFLGISLICILNGDIIRMNDTILSECEVISNEFECNTKI